MAARMLRLASLMPVARPAFRRPDLTLTHVLRGTTRWMSSASLPRPPDLKTLETPDDNASARTWIENFKSAQIPKEVVEMSYSRSSGPGGQVASLPTLSLLSGC